MDPRTLQTVVVALHARPYHFEELLLWFDLQRSRLAVEEAVWPHVSSSDEHLRLIFGRGGLKRVVAPHLPDQLAVAGFRYRGVSIERQKAVYSKKDVRLIKRRGYEYAREGRPKTDSRGKQVWKEALMLTFHRAPRQDADFTHPHAALLGHLLQDCGWRQARVLEQFEPERPSAGLALVELMLPNAISDSSVELHYGATRGFWSEPFRRDSSP